MNVCKRCGAVTDTAKFCGECGAALTGPVPHTGPTQLCVHCKQTVPRGVTKCMYCGGVLGSAAIIQGVGAILGLAATGVAVWVFLRISGVI
jgi:RNA polymerase subunit RPABC4/transcription elongation factor Spt4